MNRRTFRTALLRLLSLLALALGAPPALEANDSAITRARSLVQETMAEDHLPGLSIAVAQNGEIVWSEAFGFTDLEHRASARPESKFRVGSISKALTSAALGRLVENGKLDLDAEVQRYAPAYPEKRWPVTVRQVAAHLSGIPHCDDTDFINTVRYESVTAALTKFADRPLLFEPGTRFSYSSFGWNLLAAVVEGAAGEPFLDFMARRVFAPLGLERTLPDHYDDIIPDRVSFYGVLEGRTLKAPAIDNSDVWAGGGFLSTAEDLVAFAEAMRRAKSLERSTVDVLWTVEHASDGTPTGYGLGWQWRRFVGRDAVGHSGGHVGATAEMWIVPEHGLVFAVLTNANSAGVARLPGALVEIFLDKEGLAGE